MSTYSFFVRGLVPISLLAAAVGLGACSHSPPGELQAARSAYDRASHGPAATYDPTDLRGAREMLNVAEHAFDVSGDSEQTRAISYAAIRRTQVAEARAQAQIASRQEAAAATALQQAQAQQAQLTSAELGQTQQQLAQERAHREEEERRARDAENALKNMGNVKSESRGLVITLGGSVFFPSGKANILPSSRSRLTEVAKEVAQMAPERKILVEGFTDSTGPSSLNEELSQKRADAVKDVLVENGVPADRITTKGMGEEHPVASNATPEGRANNRRVEIVITPPENKGGPSTTKPDTEHNEQNQNQP